MKINQERGKKKQDELKSRSQQRWRGEKEAAEDMYSPVFYCFVLKFL